MNQVSQLIDLASERLGGRALLANDEFFAPKENLLKPGRAVFIEDKYTDCGKWMDGWETRRRREPGHDWCIVALGLPGAIHAVTVDTSHFKGNHPAACAVDAAAIDRPIADENLATEPIKWMEIVPQSRLEGDSENRFAVHDQSRATHVRLRIFPDGGVARLRVLGEALPDWDRILADGAVVDFAAIVHGGTVLSCSDMHFGQPLNMLMPDRAANMGDGWETRRRRGPGHDWTIIKLGRRCQITSIEVDTNHFKGNFPESCSIDACDARAGMLDGAQANAATWTTILPRTPLRPDDRRVFEHELKATHPCTHLRLSIFPDGGVSRLRVMGAVAAESKEIMTPALQHLNSLPADQAETQFLRCCGSTRWAERMVDQRPFSGLDSLVAAADRTWQALHREDWLEAFGHHPRIGGRDDRSKSASTRAWSRQEQSGVSTAGEQTLATLAELNHAYERKFGYVYLVCATGKSAEAMMQDLRQRLDHDPAIELKIAAEQQRQITRLRLEKLLQP